MDRATSYVSTSSLSVGIRVSGGYLPDKIPALDDRRYLPVGRYRGEGIDPLGWHMINFRYGRPWSCIVIRIDTGRCRMDRLALRYDSRPYPVRSVTSRVKRGAQGRRRPHPAPPSSSGGAILKSQDRTGGWDYRGGGAPGPAGLARCLTVDYLSSPDNNPITVWDFK